MVDEQNKNAGCDIYGVDISQAVTPLMARDALVKCFQSAHAKELEGLKDYGDVSGEEFEKIKRVSVETLIKGFFAENNDDFNAPTRESLERVVGKLAAFAKNFRNQEIVKQHYEEMMRVMEKVQ